MSQSYMPAFAPVVALAFLGTAALLLAAAAGAAAALLLRKWRLTKWLAAAGLALAAGYLALLLAASFTSRPRILKPGERKYFCETDYHLAYSVERVSATTQPTGTSYVVSIRAWFDPSTIAPFRGDAPLTPNPRMIFVEDEAGRRFGVSPASRPALEALARALRPGESSQASVAFDLPPGVQHARLLVGDPNGLENALIGHENSPWHGKIYFALEPSP